MIAACHSRKKNCIPSRIFCRLPDDGRRYEISHGRLVSEPLPGFGHGLVALRVGEALSAHVRAHGLGVAVTCDTGFVLNRGPDTVRGPDVAFVTRDRYEQIEDKSVAFEGAPDLAVEVVSSGNRRSALRDKLSEYLHAGTRSVWVVDPQSETVSVYSPGAEPAVLASADLLSAPEVVPGFSVAVGDLFSD